MGWTGKVTEINLGMVFRKAYCPNCGHKLNVKKTNKVIEKGDSDFKEHYPVPRQIPIGMDRVRLNYYIYYCSNCESRFLYDDIVFKKNKRVKKIIYDIGKNIDD